MTQRSPVIFWLLLAATLAVYAVAVSTLSAYRVFGERFSGTAAALFDALSFGQLSLVSMGAVFAPRGRRWVGLLWLVAAVFGVATITAWLANFRVWETAAVYGGHVTALTLLLWIIKQTRLWHGTGPTQPLTKWQFSLAQLLILMTVVAAVISSLRDSELAQRKPAGLLLGVVAAHVSVGVITLIVWLQPWHLVLRLAAMFAAAGLIGWAVEQWVSPYSVYAPENLLIAVGLISAWLELGGIVRRGDRGGDDSTTSQPPGPPV
jgi:hypothetical protein